MKKPPDKNNEEQVYKIIKCPLKTVLKQYDILQPIIDDVVKDINKFVILGYQFIKLYLLDKFNNNKPFPTINKNFILDVLHLWRFKMPVYLNKLKINLFKEILLFIFNV